MRTSLQKSLAAFRRGAALFLVLAVLAAVVPAAFAPEAADEAAGDEAAAPEAAVCCRIFARASPEASRPDRLHNKPL